VIYKCELCQTTQKKMGDMAIGKSPKGRKYQICKKCIEKLGFETSEDVDKYYEKRGEII